MRPIALWRCASPSGRFGAIRPSLMAALAVAFGSPFAFAQDAARGPGISVVPVFSIVETYTDNRKLTTTDRQSELITQISPGVQISSRSGAVQGSLSYAASGVLYARDSSANTIQNQLSANGTAELVERRLFVDAAAAISQQAVSAFGTQSAGSVTDISNRTEVSTYSLSPYLRGRLLGSVDYQARLSYLRSSGSAGALGDTKALTGTAGLSGMVGRIGWSLDGSRNATEYDDGRRYYTGRFGGSLVSTSIPDLRLTVRLARESSDLNQSAAGNKTSWGAGALWTPGPRTTVGLDADRRYFGNSHALTLQHRFARSIWVYTDSRDVTTGGVSGRQTFSLYDLFFAQFASIEPDPLKRDTLVRNFLRANGLDPTTTTLGGFLTASPSVQRRQNLSVSLQGLRSTVTVAGFQSTSSQLDPAAAGGDLGQAAEVRQLGWNVTVSYRLTPVASFIVVGSMLKTPDSGSFAGNDLRTLMATWQSSVGQRAQVSLGVRYAVFDSEANPYHETALIGSLSLRF